MSVITKAARHERISVGLAKAEEFISDELAQRRGSFLPGPTSYESSYIEDAEAALKAVRVAIEAVKVISAGDQRGS